MKQLSECLSEFEILWSWALASRSVWTCIHCTVQVNESLLKYTINCIGPHLWSWAGGAWSVPLTMIHTFFETFGYAECEFNVNWQFWDSLPISVSASGTTLCTNSLQIFWLFYCFFLKGMDKMSQTLTYLKDYWFTVQDCFGFEKGKQLKQYKLKEN